MQKKEVCSQDSQRGKLAGCADLNFGRELTWCIPRLSSDSDPDSDIVSESVRSLLLLVSLPDPSAAPTKALGTADQELMD